MRNDVKEKTPKRTGKAAKLQSLTEVLGFDLSRYGAYIPADGIEELLTHLKSGTPSNKMHSEPAKQETDEQIDKRLQKRFKAMNKLTQSCISGEIRSLVVSGEPGLGKSYDIEQALKAYDRHARKYTIVKGVSHTPGILKQLWDHRADGQILVFDDCDAIWNDEGSLSLLKAATDTSEERIISYLSEGKLLSDKDKSIVANRFPFEGTVIFITNMDLDAFATSNHRFAPHMSAIMSRGQYVDLTMRNRRDYLVRIRQVVKIGLLNHMKLDDAKEVMEYVEENYMTLRELSLRMVLKIAKLKTLDPKDWREMAGVTCYRA